MRSPVTLTMGLLTGLAIGLSVRAPEASTPVAIEQMDAASRDGAFQAIQDAERGRKPRLLTGRWGSNADRALFIAGYERAYELSSASHAAAPAKANAAEIAGYRDGVEDGVADHKAAHAFRLEKADRYLTGGHPALQTDPTAGNYRREYRSAYANGYQQGYYSEKEPRGWSYYEP